MEDHTTPDGVREGGRRIDLKEYLNTLARLVASDRQPPDHVTLSLARTICQELVTEERWEEIDALFSGVFAPYISLYRGVETILRAEILNERRKGNFREACHLIENGCFRDHGDGSDLIKVWDTCQYELHKQTTKRPLTALAKYRIREKFPPPKSICRNGIREKRTILGEKARTTLANFYQCNKYPSTKEKLDLADSLDLKKTQVHNWFSNRRRTRQPTVAAAKEQKVALYAGGFFSGAPPSSERVYNHYSQDVNWQDSTGHKEAPKPPHGYTHYQPNDQASLCFNHTMSHTLQSRSATYAPTTSSHGGQSFVSGGGGGGGDGGGGGGQANLQDYRPFRPDAHMQNPLTMLHTAAEYVANLNGSYTPNVFQTTASQLQPSDGADRSYALFPGGAGLAAPMAQMGDPHYVKAHPCAQQTQDGLATQFGHLRHMRSTPAHRSEMSASGGGQTLLSGTAGLTTAPLCQMGASSFYARSHPCVEWPPPAPNGHVNVLQSTLSQSVAPPPSTTGVPGFSVSMGSQGDGPFYTTSCHTAERTGTRPCTSGSETRDRMLTY